MTYSPYKEKTVMAQKNSEKATSPKKKKGEKKQHVWLSGRMHIEERRTIEPRAAASVKAKTTKMKQSRTNVTPEKDDMTSSANQTPGGYKFTPLVTNQLCRANQHGPACFGLSSPCILPVTNTRAHAYTCKQGQKSNVVIEPLHAQG